MRRIREWFLCCLCFGGAPRELHGILSCDGHVDDDEDDDDNDDDSNSINNILI